MGGKTLTINTNILDLHAWMGVYFLKYAGTFLELSRQTGFVFCSVCRGNSWEFPDRITTSPQFVTNSILLEGMAVCSKTDSEFCQEIPREFPDRIDDL